MKRLSILMAVLAGAVPIMAGAATTGGMPAAIGPSCGAGSPCLSAGAVGQPGAMTVAGPDLTQTAQTAGAMSQMAAVAISGGGQGAAAAGNVGGMSSGGAATGAANGAGPGGMPAGVNSGSPNGANGGASGIGNDPGGAMSQPAPSGGDNRNFFNRRTDRGAGSAPSGGLPSVSEGDAARRVQQSTGARILDVKPENTQGRLTYRFKVLNDAGEVRIITIDAQTGERE